MDDLMLCCYRVAGTVGLMMCHVMGVSDRRALRHAAHLGMAMQLTNICRDVMEDWERGHLYLPDQALGPAVAGQLWARRGGPLPREFRGESAAAGPSPPAPAARAYPAGDPRQRRPS